MSTDSTYSDREVTRLYDALNPWGAIRRAGAGQHVRLREPQRGRSGVAGVGCDAADEGRRCGRS